MVIWGQVYSSMGTGGDMGTSGCMEICNVVTGGT